jgi:hypothetical protein
LEKDYKLLKELKKRIAAQKDLDKKVAMKTARRGRERERGEGVLLDVIFPLVLHLTHVCYVSPTPQHR